MPVNSTIKSSRLLQSRRYTHDSITDAQDVFGRVLDLSTAEIYSQASLIPSSSVPLLTTTGETYTASAQPILRYWYQQPLTPSSVLGANNYKEVWFFLSSSTSASTTPFATNPEQQFSFVSNKYAVPSLGPYNAESAGANRAYSIKAYKNGTSTEISTDDYVFDYKTGVFEFITNASAAGVSSVYVTAYQYIGRTLADNDIRGISGSFSGSFQGDGSLLTNVPAGSISGLSLNQIAAGTVTASVSAGTTSLTLASSSVSIFTVGNQGAVTASVFSGALQGRATGSFSGSLIGIVTGSLTGSFTGIGSGSFSGSFAGDGSQLSSVPASAIVGLNLSRVASGSVSASIGVGSTALEIVSASTTLATFNNQGGLTLTSTASLRDTNITGSLIVSSNLTVLGTASFTSITSSQIVVSGSGILLYTDYPAIRFAGLNVVDSQSFGNISSGSLLWDSLNNHWVYASPSGGTYDGAGLMSGPRNTSGLGNESYPAKFSVLRGQGEDHLEGSNIHSSASRVFINKTVPSSTAEVEINGSVYITGSTLQASPDGAVPGKYAMIVSQSGWFNSVNVGYPVGNQWGSSLTGSVFQNYDHNTDVGTILRLMAGYLSSSLPTPVANGKTYNTNGTAFTGTDSGLSISGIVPQDYATSTKAGSAEINYLVSKGFASTGGSLFSGIPTIYYNTSFTSKYTSGTPGGTPTVSSSNNVNLFGVGALNTVVYMSGSNTYRFSDNSSQTIVATSASNQIVSQNGPGSTGGLYVYQISTANPSVISPVFQDGLFIDAFTRGIFNGGVNIDGRSSTSVSSSGYYYFTSSIGISSSAAAGYTTRTVQGAYFWAPMSTLTAAIANNTGSLTSGSTALTATSRSLSGAPYLSTSTYAYEVTMSGLFDPLYVNNDTIGNVALSSGPVTIPATTATINAAGQIGLTNTVYSSSGVARVAGTIPFRTDIVKLTLTASSNFSTNTNIQSQGSSSNTFVLANTAKRRDGSTTGLTPTSTISLFTPGTFGQPLSSGSMAYFGRTQGTDPGTNTLEQFYGENNRRYVSSSLGDVIAFTAPSWDTAYGVYNLPEKELQVKPGFLVRPGGSYKYWLNDPQPLDTFKYYVREVTCGVTAPTSIVFSITSAAGGVTLQEWSGSAGSAGIAIAVMFQSSTAAQLGTTARLFNLSKGGGAVTTPAVFAAGTANNPFGSSYVLYNAGGGSAGTYTMPVDNGIGMNLNGGTLTKYYVIVRYQGDPSPLTQISISYT